MAQAFNLTAQLQLQSPRNVDKVVNDIRRRLKPIGVSLKLDGAKNLSKVNSEVKSVTKSTQELSQASKNVEEAFRRFSVITIGTGIIINFTNAVKNSIKEAIEFERELVKISQVTGKTVPHPV